MTTIISNLALAGLYSSVAFATEAAQARKPRVLEEAKPEPVETQDDMAARVDDDVAKAISESHSSANSLARACASSLMFAALHSQPGKFTKLWKECSLKDREAVRVFYTNVLKTHGVEVEKRQISFLSYNKDNGFSMSQFEKGTEKHTAAKAMRDSIVKTGEHGLKIIPLGKTNAEREMDNVFNPEKKVTDFLKSLARNGEIALAKQINRAIDANMQVTDGVLEEAAKNGDTNARIAKKEKELAALKAQAANKAKAKEAAN